MFANNLAMLQKGRADILMARRRQALNDREPPRRFVRGAKNPYGGNLAVTIMRESAEIQVEMLDAAARSTRERTLANIDSVNAAKEAWTAGVAMSRMGEFFRVDLERY